MSVKCIREALVKPMTHADLRELTGLKHEQIGMLLNYLLKRGELKRKKQPATSKVGRREVYVYWI